MYWPFGAPRIYAATDQKSTKEHVLESGESANAHRAEGPDNVNAADISDKVGGSRIDDGNGEIGISQAGHEQVILKSHPRKSLENGLNGRGPQTSGSSVPGGIIGLRVSRNGLMFATITSTILTIWQTRPTAVLASVVRSQNSLRTHGVNTSLLLRPDSAIFVVQTSLGYLITYSLATDPNSRVYTTHIESGHSGASRFRSASGSRSHTGGERILRGAGEDGGVREVSVRFKMVIKVDAGIERALALDEELVVATEKPAAVQCIRWTPDSNGNQTSTELLSRMGWMSKKATVSDMVHDRPMNLSTWITSDGKAYAVQRLSGAAQDMDDPRKLFKGYCFHSPENEEEYAMKASINARFSLIAIGCTNGTVLIYTVRDYAGNIPLSYRLKPTVSLSSSGRINSLSYSPDGYCLFAGFEKGWITWSVYGKPGGTSFTSDRHTSKGNGEEWLDGIREASWLAGGSEVLLVAQNDDRLWLLEMARSAVAGCFSAANISRSLLQTNSGFMVYRGYDQPDLTTISAESSLWHHVQIPTAYLAHQWPIRQAVVSPDGRYVAVAGRRGLAHYSVNSGRWKTFVNENMENEFVVRGGMCWYQHILIAAVESGDHCELRLYSRELSLDNSLLLHTEKLPSPVVLTALSGEDSLLVYTYDNILYHYIITATSKAVKLVQVGQIAFHGIVRAPARVRAVSWILPDEHLQDGDPSQDVAVASVIFLVDGKLVLLQPSTTDGGELKYDMRVISHNVEYYALMRDQSSQDGSLKRSEPSLSPGAESLNDSTLQGHGLRDSLWVFDGTGMRVWVDVQDILRSGHTETMKDLPPSVLVPADFYPLSILLNKGVVLGIESDLVQRRDINYAYFKFSLRTHLFLPHLLRYYLSQYNHPAALHLSYHYQDLLYFPHALEVLLHDVLDEEADKPASPEAALLPVVLSFLSSFPQYLDILVQCTRKTEMRSWRTLFAYLPPPEELFEESLQRGLLKTAGGYLLVLHTFQELGSSSPQLVRLFSRAKEAGDWELCKELARFLTALDDTGATLREALELVELRSSQEDPTGSSFMFQSARLDVPHRSGNGNGVGLGIASGEDGSSTRSGSRSSASVGEISEESGSTRESFLSPDHG
ncbi:hypothetical protein GP486_003670 [Trichoglossum hirsutum]|uniref:RIC1 C-terminal alpha solenoid region domain-containing protein n=1 Tax=Trichoglossum hirsutum TaxID=265104 RepID=A0A9P8RQD2_9PEZI|nr:hypothetical protein GP486_003670 [Trichoglossum hirsutum]